MTLPSERIRDGLPGREPGKYTPSGWLTKGMLLHRDMVEKHEWPTGSGCTLEVQLHYSALRGKWLVKVWHIGPAPAASGKFAWRQKCLAQYRLDRLRDARRKFLTAAAEVALGL